MLMVTAEAVEGKRIARYLGIVSGEAVVGGNASRDLAAGLARLFGRRGAPRQTPVKRGRDQALADLALAAGALGADAVVGVHMQLETLGNRMLLVNAVGTAVMLEDAPATPASEPG